MTKAERLEEGIRFWEEELNAFKDEGIETIEMREYDRLVIEAARTLEKIIEALKRPACGLSTLTGILEHDGWV